MPTTTMTHEPWCADHADDAGWNMCCTDTIEFGPRNFGTESDEHRGALWLRKDEPSGNVPEVSGSYGSLNIQLDIETARAVLEAVSDDAWSLQCALESALGHLDAEVSA